MDDFIVKVTGHCFLCLDEILPELPTVISEAGTSTSSPVSSIQCLSRYLKLNINEALTREDLVPQHLRRLVKRSNLIVELCAECSSWNEKFSELYQKLEIIGMEVASHLKPFHGKLLNKIEDGPKTRELESRETLRRDVTRKCSSKLSKVKPMLQLQKLSPEEVLEKQLSLKCNFWVSAPRSSSHQLLWRDSHESCPGFEVDTDNIKVERYDDNEDGISFGQDEDEPIIDFLEVKLEVQNEDVKIDPLNVLDKSSSLSKSDERSHSSFVDSSHSKSEGKTQTTNDSPSSSTGNSRKPQISLNSETGQHKCDICSREFSAYTSAYLHHRSVHLQIRYSCKLCRKSFTQASSRNLHVKSTCKLRDRKISPNSQTKKDGRSRSSGSEKPFQCDLCGNGYNKNAALQRHQESVHLGIKFECDLCDSVFTQKDNLNTHKRSVHHGERFECPRCSKWFSTSGNRSFHMKKCGV